MKTFTLTNKEHKLLLMILKECEEERSNMGCNDPYKEEEKLFTEKERIEMQESMYKEGQLDDDDKDGFLFNFQYVKHIINQIKKSAE